MTGAAAQRLRLALLAILAASPRGLGRDTVAALLWGERDEERARHSLEQALYALKRSLGADPVQRTSTTLLLDPTVVRADVREFDRAIETDAVDTALKLYGGSFLEGVYLEDAPEFERWSERERSRRRDAYHRALEQRAHLAEQQQKPHDAVRWWRRLYEENQLSTRHAMELARAMAAAGDRLEAIRLLESHSASAPDAPRHRIPSELGELLGALRGSADAAPEEGAARSPSTGDALSVAISHALGTDYRIEGRFVRSRLYVSFRARQAKTGRLLIVKVLEPSIVRFGDRSTLCRHLERVLALKHDHLTATQALGTTEDLVYLIGQDDEGETLRDHVQRRGELAVAEGVAALREIADALAYAHEAGVLHLDLTPKRIVLTARGALLRDIGIASAIMAAAAHRGGVEETNVVLGTTAFMSPELALARGTPNEQSDLFSLAAAFFQALTGTLPFGAAGAGAQSRPSAPSAAAIRSTIPHSVDAALTRALSPVRSDRQPGVRAFLQELAPS